jgi:hypothetical protein
LVAGAQRQRVPGPQTISLLRTAVENHSQSAAAIWALSVKLRLVEEIGYGYFYYTNPFLSVADWYFV